MAFARALRTRLRLVLKGPFLSSPLLLAWRRFVANRGTNMRILATLAAATLAAGCSLALDFDKEWPGPADGAGGDGAGGDDGGGAGCAGLPTAERRCACQCEVVAQCLDARATAGASCDITTQALSREVFVGYCVGQCIDAGRLPAFQQCDERVEDEYRGSNWFDYACDSPIGCTESAPTSVCETAPGASIGAMDSCGDTAGGWLRGPLIASTCEPRCQDLSADVRRCIGRTIWDEQTDDADEQAVTLACGALETCFEDAGGARDLWPEPGPYLVP
jgi:hypothetical protein